MSVVRLDPFRGFDSLAKKMNSFIDEFDKGVNIEFGSFVPRIDIIEDESSYNVHAELAGLKKDDVKVSINDDNVLMIKGNKEKQYKKEETDNDGKLVFLKMERNYGEFARSFQLPENLDKSSISAKFEDGILNIKINKKEPEKPKETVVNID